MFLSLHSPVGSYSSSSFVVNSSHSCRLSLETSTLLSTRVFVHVSMLARRFSDASEGQGGSGRLPLAFVKLYFLSDIHPAFVTDSSSSSSSSQVLNCGQKWIKTFFQIL